MNREPLRIAIIGTGIAGTSHLLDAVTAQRMEVVAVCARTRHSAERAAAEFGIGSAFNDLETMLAIVPLDAVVIATPPNVMASHAAMCLIKGLDVLVEKPMATSAADLRTLMSALSTRRHRLAIAYPRRYRAGWQEANNWLHEARLGQVTSVHCHWRNTFAERYAPDALTYRADRIQSVGGVMLDTGSHILDALDAMFGTPGEVRTAQFICNERGVDVGVVARLEIAGGVDVKLEIIDTSCEPQQTIVVCGQRGQITINDDRALLDADCNIQVVENTYVRRPVDDLVALRDRGSIMGADFAAGMRVASALIRVYAAAGHPLQPRHRWRRPRAKALARLSGAC
jgi:predicted dehydrogenase